MRIINKLLLYTCLSWTFILKLYQSSNINVSHTMLVKKCELKRSRFTGGLILSHC